MHIEGQILFVRHCLNSVVKKGAMKRRLNPNDQIFSKVAKTSPFDMGIAPTADTVTPVFELLVPGPIGSKVDSSFLKGKFFVISGFFPEVGGGNYDNVGVDSVKRMIESFGGKVVVRFSKNTSEYLSQIHSSSNMF